MTFQRPSIEELQRRFEADINRNARIYNLTPAISEKKEKGETYWALHTERAWDVFQMGVNAAFDAIESQQATSSAEEYQSAKQRLEDAQTAYNAEEARLKAEGCDEDEMSEALVPFSDELAAAEVAFDDLAP